MVLNWSTSSSIHLSSKLPASSAFRTKNSIRPNLVGQPNRIYSIEIFVEYFDRVGSKRVSNNNVFILPQERSGIRENLIFVRASRRSHPTVGSPL